MGYGTLLGVLAARAVLNIPRSIVRSVGLGYKGRFTIGNVTFDRPEHFRSTDHKFAFEAVGGYLTDALTRDVMLSFRDRDLAQKSLWGYEKVPLGVWHEVLEFYERLGAIVPRWELGLPSYGASLTQPSWGPQGERFEAPKVGAISGVVPDSAPFDPGLLTGEQKRELLGKPYALHPADGVGPGSWQKKEQEYVTLGEEHFARVYYRRRELLTEKDLAAGAETLKSVFKAANGG